MVWMMQHLKSPASDDRNRWVVHCELELQKQNKKYIVESNVHRNLIQNFYSKLKAYQPKLALQEWALDLLAGHRRTILSRISGGHFKMNYFQ